MEFHGKYHNDDNNSLLMGIFFGSRIQNRKEDPITKGPTFNTFHGIIFKFCIELNFPFPHRNRFIYKMIGYETN